MKITLKHPFKNEPPIEVEDSSSRLIQLMVEGYSQVNLEHKNEPQVQPKTEPKEGK